MKKNVFLLFLLLASIPTLKLHAQGPFSPAAGQPGSTAIHMDSSIITCWATGVELKPGWQQISNPVKRASYGIPSNALGKAQGNSFNVISLGDAGIATLTFDRPIINGPGNDFAVFENGFDDTALELAFVEVSSDGKKFVRLPAVSLTPTTTQVGGYGTVDPTYIHNLAGKYRQGYGTPFDLEDIKDSTDIDLYNVRFVRVIDVIGSIDLKYASTDSKGNIINDPWPTAGGSSGFDLDGIAVIHAGNPFVTASFDDLSLEEDSYWNGSDQVGSFTNGLAVFENSYNPDFYSWSGFAYSNMRDNTSVGFNNQFSAYTRGGMEAGTAGGTAYAVGFVPADWEKGTYQTKPINITFGGKSVVPGGFYVTNSTFAALLMEHGDAYTKKFGGTTGNDPDWFKLLIWGEKEDGTETDQVEYYLADFRSDNQAEDYIVKDWRWVDLKSLGKVNKIRFDLKSTDVGMFGINTPTYFCMDNLTLAEPYLYVAESELQMTNGEVKFDIRSNVEWEVTYDQTWLKATPENGSDNAVVTLKATEQLTQDRTATITVTDGTLAKELQLTQKLTTNSTAETGIKNITVYPNPVANKLYIQFENSMFRNILITDLSGMKILETSGTNQEVNLDLTQIAHGVYLVSIKTADGNYTTKIIKN